MIENKFKFKNIFCLKQDENINARFILSNIAVCSMIRTLSIKPNQNNLADITHIEMDLHLNKCINGNYEVSYFCNIPLNNYKILDPSLHRYLFIQLSICLLLLLPQIF